MTLVLPNKLLSPVIPDPVDPTKYIKFFSRIVIQGVPYLLFTFCLQNGEADFDAHKHVRCLNWNGQTFCYKLLEYRKANMEKIISHDCEFFSSSSSSGPVVYLPGSKLQEVFHFVFFLSL
jgi:hypothetical protein